jgi:hypothetical protein
MDNNISDDNFKEDSSVFLNKLINNVKYMKHYIYTEFDDSFTKKAIYAFLSEWNSAIYSTMVLFKDGTNNIHMAFCLIRTAYEIFSQLRYLVCDKYSMHEKAICVWLVTNDNVYKLNNRFFVLRKKNMSEQAILNFQQTQMACDISHIHKYAYWKHFGNVDKHIIKTYVTKIKDNQFVNRDYCLWYAIYAEVLGLKNSTGHPKSLSFLVNQYGIRENETSNKTIYNFISNYAHGYNTLINKDYGNIQDAIWGVEIIYEMYKIIVSETPLFFANDNNNEIKEFCNNVNIVGVDSIFSKLYNKYHKLSNNNE